jgi:hypothetical protein
MKKLSGAASGRALRKQHKPQTGKNPKNRVKQDAARRV